MQRGGPTAGRWTNNAKLQHVIEFLARYSESFWGETLSASSDLRASCSDLVRYTVFDRLFTITRTLQQGTQREVLHIRCAVVAEETSDWVMHHR